MIAIYEKILQQFMYKHVCISFVDQYIIFPNFSDSLESGQNNFRADKTYMQ